MSETQIPPGGISGVEVIRRALAELPLTPGIYRMLGENGEALYVGKAKQLRARVSNYTNLMQLTGRIQRMVMATKRLEVTLTGTEAEALLLEATLIKSEKPRYNILLKDDKSFPYIQITGNHPFPRIAKYRGVKDQAGDYFGPFVSALAVNETLTVLQKAFLLRPCADTVFKNRTRPCLQYQIKRCSAPCVDFITKPEYSALVTQAKRFLRGGGKELQAQLASEMQTASENQDYERAARLRDRLRSLAHVLKDVYTHSGLEDADVIALARAPGGACVQVFSYRGGRNCGNRAHFPVHTEEAPSGEILAAFIAQYYQRQGVPPRVLVNAELPDMPVLAEALSLLAREKIALELYDGEAMTQAHANAQAALTQHLHANLREQALLEAVAKLFNLPAPPERIEIYDNSHVMGTNAVGAMVVAGPEGMNKKAYRIFNIKSENLTPGDDYAMLREVFTRRFKRMLEEGKDAPDLVLVDGGPGQLTAARQVFADLGVDLPLAAISKGPDRNAGREWFHTAVQPAFQLPPDDPVLHYLQRLRDEAHRFAIGAHRNRRSKEVRKSALDEIPNIGPSRKRSLIQFFGSGKAVSEASAAEIAQAPGISKELANQIFAYFQGK